MKRRTFLGALAASALAAPAVRAAAAPVLRFVPNVDLPVLDPIANTAAQVRNHAFLVWDTLYGLDDKEAPQPQMVEGHSVEKDGREWVLTLRPGLKFHDGEPVLARDVVASLRRWSAVDGFGATLFAVTDELAELDDRRLRFRLSRPFPLLPEALGKIEPNVPVIMPARIASAPPNKPVAEIVGSGPFRFVAGERVPGSRLVYERFADYVPRADGPVGLTSGPKRVFVDRVEWVIMPEPATVANALAAGEVDWWEAATPDLQPMLRKSPGLTVRVNDQDGVMAILRFNTLHPPFDNPAIRRAVLAAVNQAEFMQAFTDDRSLWHVKMGAFNPHAPEASGVGFDALFSTTDIAPMRKAIAEAGYKGERTVVLYPTDHPVNSVMAQMGADLFRKLGLNVDLQAMDAATMFQRRTSREPVDKGGWSCFPSAIAGALSPAEAFQLRGNGKSAWYGWPDAPALEAGRAAWLAAPDDAARHAACDDIQRALFAFAPHLPLGQILQPTAYRRGLTGLLPGFAKFWNVQLNRG